MNKSNIYIALFVITYFILTIYVLGAFEKKSTRNILIILLWAFIMAVIGFACTSIAMSFVFDYGIFWFPLFSILTVIAWTILAKLCFKLKLRTMFLVGLLPICFYCFFFLPMFIYIDYENPIINAKHLTVTMQSGVKEFFKAANKFKNDCGRYPENLKEIINPVANCPKWKGWETYNYIQGERRIFDPWNRRYIYKTHNADSIEVSSLGADGVSGGEGINQDFSLKN
jgi:hypothetical protein